MGNEIPPPRETSRPGKADRERHEHLLGSAQPPPPDRTKSGTDSSPRKPSDTTTPRETSEKPKESDKARKPPSPASLEAGRYLVENLSRFLPEYQAAIEDELGKTLGPVRANLNASPRSELETGILSPSENVLNATFSPVNFALRSQLENELKSSGKLSPQTRQALERELKAGNIRPELVSSVPFLSSSLEKLLTGEELTGTERATLSRELAHGLFKKEVVLDPVRADLQQYLKDGSFSPRAFSAWQAAVKTEEAIATRVTNGLVAGKFINVPVGAPFTHEQYQRFLEEKEKPNIKIASDTNLLPTLKETIDFFNTRIWNRYGAAQLDANRQSGTSKQTLDLLNRFGRPNWLPGTSATDSNYEQQLAQVMPMITPAYQAQATLEALELMTGLREDRHGTQWQDDVRELLRAPAVPIFAHNQWMYEAIRTFPGNNANGLPDLPKELDDTVANHDQNKAIQDWLDKYRDRTEDKILKLCLAVDTKGIAMFGYRDRVSGANGVEGDPPLSPDGHPYNYIHYDFKVNEKKGESGEKLYEVTQQTYYLDSRWYKNPYDIGAHSVDSKPEEVTNIYTDDDLVPLVLGGQFYGVEPGRLATLHSRQRTGANVGTGISAGIDAIWLASAVGLGEKTAKTGAEVAAKGAMEAAVGAKTSSQALLRKELLGKLWSMTGKIGKVVLPASGALNSAEVRQSTPGQIALGARHAAILGMAAYHLYKGFAGSGESLALADDAVGSEIVIGDIKINTGRAAGELAPSAGAAEAQALPAARTPAGELAGNTSAGAASESQALAETRANAGELAQSAPTAPDEGQLARTQTASGEAEAVPQQMSPRMELLGKITTKVSAATEHTVEATNKNMQWLILALIGKGIVERKMAFKELSEESNSQIGKLHDAYQSLQHGAYLSSAKDGLTSGATPAVAARLSSILDIKESAFKPDSPDRTGKIAELEGILDSKNSSKRAGDRREIVAAQIGLLQLARQEDGSLAEKIGSHSTAQMLDSLRTDFRKSSVPSRDTNSYALTPDASLVVAQNLLAFGNITGQQYALEASRIANDPKAADETKMKAITGMGLTMWAAANTEKDSPNDMNYWATSHGCSREELQQKLSDLAHGKTGGNSPDVRAFAASMLYAMSHDQEEKRAQLFDQAVKDWQEKYSAQSPGAYAQQFISNMQQEMQTPIPAEPRKGYSKEGLAELEKVRTRQYLAAAALVEVDSNPKTTQEALNTIVQTMDSKLPSSVAVRAISNLTTNLDKIDPQAYQTAVNNVIALLERPNQRALGNPEEISKIRLIPMLPKLLARNNNSDQYHDVVDRLSQIIDPSQVNNPVYGPTVNLRSVAAETLGLLRAKEAEGVLVDLLKYNGERRAEPSAVVRQAALRALSSMGSSQLEAAARGLVETETDRQVKNEALQIVQSLEHKDGTGDALSQRGDQVQTINFRESTEFLLEWFPSLYKNNYDARIASATPDLSTPTGWLKKLAMFEENQLSFDPKKYSVLPEEAWAGIRGTIASDHIDEVLKLGRWAKGEFLTKEEHPQDAQKQAINLMARLIDESKRERVDDSQTSLLPDFDRVATRRLAARTLREISETTQDNVLRAQVAGHIKNLVVHPDIDFEARWELLRALPHLFTPPERAVISKAEAGALTVRALACHRASIPLEERPLSSNKEQADQQKEEAKRSRFFQKVLMNEIAYRYQDRAEGLALIEKISQESKDQPVRDMAKEYALAMRNGVSLSSQLARTNPDRVTPLEDRAKAMTDALKSVEAEPEKVVSALFENCSGRPLTNNDPRLPVLLNGLQSNNERVQLASAICLVDNGAGYDTSSPAMHKLVQLAFAAVDPAVRQKASMQIGVIEKDNIRRLNNTEWLTKNPSGRTEVERQSCRQKAITDAILYRNYKESLARLVAEAKEGVVSYWDSGAQFHCPLPVERGTEELRQLMTMSKSQANGTDPVARIFAASFGADFKSDGTDNRGTLLRNIAEKNNERMSLAASTALAYLSANADDCRFGIDKLVKLEATAGSATIKREAGVLLDRFVAQLEQQTKSEGKPELRHAIDFVQRERARALGVPITLRSQ